MDKKDSTGWVIDVLIGVFAGGVVGVIAAVNIVIFAGPDDGYQSSVSDVFEQTPVTGIVAGAVLIACPVLGVVALRLLRQRT